MDQIVIWIGLDVNLRRLRSIVVILPRFTVAFATTTSSVLVHGELMGFGTESIDF